MFGDVPDEQQLHVIVFERHLNFRKREIEVPPLQIAQAHSGISAHLFQGEVELGRLLNLK